MNIREQNTKKRRPEKPEKRKYEDNKRDNKG